MKNFNGVVLLVTAAVAGTGWTAAAEDAKGDAVKKELAKLAGTWRLLSFEKDGVKAPEADVKQVKITFKGDKFTLERAGKTVEEGWVAIDPARKPKAADIYPTKPESKVVMGIYEWDGGDKIRLCGTHPGTEQTRPTLFSTTKGTGHVLFVCQREQVK